MGRNWVEKYDESVSYSLIKLSNSNSPEHLMNKLLPFLLKLQ